MNYDNEHILRYIEDSLSPQEAQLLATAIANDDAIALRVERVRSLHATVTSSGANGFALGFADRVVARLRGDESGDESGDDALYRALRWVFRRAAIASLLAAIAFGALNVVEYNEGDFSSTILESIFGQPTVLLGDAIAVESV